jgi:hypothetical protein
MIPALIALAARSNLWVEGRSLTAIPGSNLLSMFVMYVANFATVRSLVKGSPTEIVFVCH